MTYEVRNPFAYSLRCSLCRLEQTHTAHQHALAVSTFQSNPNPGKHRHDYSDGDLCSICDIAKPLSGRSA